MLLTLPKFRITNAAGTPYPSARLYIYSPGTTTPITTYQDYLFATPHANPVEADSEGLFPSIYIRTDLNPTVKVIAKTSADVEIPDYTIDRITLIPSEVGALGVNGTLTATGFASFQDSAEVANSFDIRGVAPDLYLTETDASSNEDSWNVNVTSKVFSIRTRTTALGAGRDIIKVTRGTGTAISSIEIGNATDLPTITINGQPYMTTGSFTGTISDVVGTVTGTVKYFKIGRMATVYVDANLVGTSDGVGLELTLLPATIAPLYNGLEVLCSNVRDNGNVIAASVRIDSNIMTFSILDGDSIAGYVTWDTSGFTASGSKGLLAGWSVTYPTAT